MRIKGFLFGKEVKNAGWLISGRIMQMILSLLIGILATRYLGPTNYGLISYGTTYVTFFSALCSLGLNSIIIKDFIDNPKEQGISIGSAIMMRLISSIISVIMIIGIVSIVDKNEPITIIVVGLCSIGAVFHSFEVFNYWFQSQYKAKVTAITSLVAYGIMSIYKIVLLIVQADIYWFALATSLDYIAVAILLYIMYRKHNGQSLYVSITKSKNLLKMSHHYIWSSILVSIYTQTDRFMIKQFLNETEVGYYSLAASLCIMWTFVLQAIIDSIYPTILRNHKINYEAYLKNNRRLYAIVFYISIFVSLIFCVLGKQLILILYGEAFLPAVNILKIVTWYTAFSYLGVARNAWLVSENKQSYLKYLYGSAAILNIILNMIFIPYMGSIGAAIASLITQLCTSIIVPLMFKELRPNALLMIEAILLKKLK